MGYCTDSKILQYENVEKWKGVFKSAYKHKNDSLSAFLYIYAHTKFNVTVIHSHLQIFLDNGFYAKFVFCTVEV